MPIKAIITKYALTSGPILAEGEATIGNEIQMFRAQRTGIYYHLRDWHITKEDAIKNITEQAARRRLSLEKQIKKLDLQLAKAWNTINEMTL